MSSREYHFQQVKRISLDFPVFRHRPHQRAFVAELQALTELTLPVPSLSRDNGHKPHLRVITTSFTLYESSRSCRTIYPHPSQNSHDGKLRETEAGPAHRATDKDLLVNRRSLKMDSPAMKPPRKPTATLARVLELPA